jgi:hypothetical protein
MKKSILLLSFLSIVGGMYAQTNLTVSGGVRIIRPENRIVTLWYVDESPSMDNIFKEFKQQGNTCYELSLRYVNYDYNKNMQWFIEGQGYLGSLSGLALNPGLVYTGKNESKFKFQPELAASLGYSSKGIGTIENNDVYIKVNNTQFMDYTNVNVSVQNIFFGLKPGLNLGSSTGNGNEIGIRFNYLISYKMGYLNFSGTGQDGNRASDSEDMDARNVSFWVDGEKTETVPFNPDGLEIKLYYRF